MSTLTTKLYRDLRRQPTQSLAIAATIFLGTMLAAISANAYRDLQASYAKVFDLTSFADLWITGGDATALAADAAAQPGVAAAEPRVVVDVPLGIADRRLLGRVVEIPAEARVNRVLIQRGADLDPADPDGVLVEEHLANHDHLEPGDQIQILVGLSWRKVTVRGVAASAEYLFPSRSRQEAIPPPGSFGVVFVGPALAARLASAPTEVAIRYTSSPPGGAAALETRLRALAERHGAAAVTPRAEQASNATLRTDIDGFREMALWFPLLFLTAAALATAVLLSRRVRSERSVIGTLRACGMSRGRIVRHYLGHGVGLGVLGAVPGAIAGSLLSRLATSAYTGALDVPVTVTRLHPDTIALALGFGVITGVIAAAAPARAAAGIAPAQAMRGVVPDSGPAGRSWLGRLLRVDRLPARWQLVLANLGRNRRRTVSTGLGVILAATLILVGWGMLDSTAAMIDRQFGKIDRRDATLYVAGGASNDVLAAAAAVDGVASVEPLLETPAVLRGPRGDYASVLVAMPPDTVMHGFFDRDRRQHLGRGVLLGRGMAKRLGVKIGDQVHVDLPAGNPVLGRDGGALDVPVDGFVDEPLGTFAYASIDVVHAQVAGISPLGIAVKFAPGADRETVLASLAALDRVAVTVDGRALVAALDDFMALFYAFVGTMLVLGSALAFTILFVTMTVNLAERTTELATLRAAGVGLSTIARLVTAENLLVTVLSLIPGLLVGYWAAGAFMASFSSDLFTFDLALATRTPILTAVILCAVALASQLPGLRAVRKLDIARVVRERSA